MSRIESNINSLFNSMSYHHGSVLIDPGDLWRGFYDVDSVLLTHAHFDHIYGLNQLLNINPSIRVFTNEWGLKMLSDAKANMSRYHETPFEFMYPQNVITVHDSEDIELNNIIFKPVFTPGHNPSCITWVTDNEIFTGDSYIPGIKTVTNLPGGDKALAQSSLELIHSMIGNRTVYPGHKISI